MRWSLNLERSYGVALWLFAVAGLVVAMVVVGGLTRLTGSGLSITEWRPVTGAVPPLNAAAWASEFDKYRHSSQYALVNAGMTMGEFKWIYGWEWTHRFLGRLLGVAFAVPFIVFLALRSIPRRLIWRCALILVLGGLQGLVGWLMVLSGLGPDKVAVAPERLATHLGLALILYCVCVWTGLEAWNGRSRAGAAPPAGWRIAAGGVFALVFLQVVLGALVAGSGAGKIDTDWPMMAGRLFPQGYLDPARGLIGSLLHSLPAVQFNHRFTAYALWAGALGFAILATRNRFLAGPVRAWAWGLFAAISLQALLGIWTLTSLSPLALAALHQLGAVGVLSVALATFWRLLRN